MAATRTRSRWTNVMSAFNPREAGILYTPMATCLATIVSLRREFNGGPDTAGELRGIATPRPAKPPLNVLM